MEQYEKLAELMLQHDEEGKPFTFYHYMIDLTGGPCIYKRISGCGSGTEYMAVTPWGDLYPCHQFVGDDKYKLGDIAYIVINQWNPTTEIVKIITAQCQITSEPYKGFLGMWCYDAVILAQDAVYDGYPSLVGRQEREVKEPVFDGAARYMSENGISFK
mgnify:CR=1 FL=1